MQQIFITGANRGIGLAVVEKLISDSSVHVFATCRNPDSAEALTQLQAKHPERLTIVKLEVTSAESIQTAFEQVSAATDHLDVLINNAGVNHGNQSHDEITPQLMMDIYEVNTVAPLMITKQFLPLLSDGTKLVHISTSMASLANRTYGGSYAYCSSKAALNMMMRGQASDLKGHGITTIALDPGWVRTDMGGDSANLSSEESAQGIVEVISKLTAKDNGRYLAYNGTEHAW